MGDFCVAGFHSRLPIYNGNKVVAIICRRREDRNMSNQPCYLDDPLVPFCMPIVGYMNDYGYLEYIEETADTDETIRILEKVSGESVCEIIKDIVSTSQYKTDDELPEFYRKFDESAVSYRSADEPVGRYHVIYEHYNIYKEMAPEWKTIIAWCEKYHKMLVDIDYYNEKYNDEEQANPFKLDRFNVFTWYMNTHPIEKVINTINFFSKPLNEKLKAFHRLEFDDKSVTSPYRITYNMQNHDMFCFGLYTAHKIDLEKAKYQISEFCSFVSTLEYINGHFYWSVYAGQSWHHDKDYWKTLCDIQKVYNQTIEELKNSLSID